MKKNNWLTSSVLLVSVLGVLGLTTPMILATPEEEGPERNGMNGSFD
jgi:hypothetical protein